MSQATVLEVNGATAGLLVGAGERFRFFSSRPAFDDIDGVEFRSVLAAQRAVNATWRRKPVAAVA